MAEGKEFLRPSEIATHLGLTTGRVYQLIGLGIIPATRMGRSILIPRAAWQVWLDQQRDRALEDAAEVRKAVVAEASNRNG